ncbi:unnamed protein product [Medioppia subpectinata]|uniref:Uncharacterized protein n=1 Tax=Medioppia subpectinata TaxID=1979941 RepID=A0A7R9L192_9ACAR|nr:unnamed protein product [Medioppia subpectinata]CAG2112486.1 unnamed protein product [Medioppia subpectinata]
MEDDRNHTIAGHRVWEPLPEDHNERPLQNILFMVSKNILYKSVVDVSAGSLVWTQLSSDPILANTMGGFLSESHLMFNIIDATDQVLIGYDQNGKHLDKTSVLKYFGCRDDTSNAANNGANHRSDDSQDMDVLRSNEELDKNNNKTALIIIMAIIVTAVIVNIFSAVFWFAVFRNKWSSDQSLDS